jgi:hypothetical protein
MKRFHEHERPTSISEHCSQPAISCSCFSALPRHPLIVDPFLVNDGVLESLKFVYCLVIRKVNFYLLKFVVSVRSKRNMHF